MRETPTARWVRRVGLTLLSAFVAFPLYMIISVSFSPLSEVSGTFHWIPRHLTAAPYRDAWTTLPLGRYFANSALVAGCSTVLALVVAVPAAYALSRYTFLGSRLIGYLLAGSQLVPGVLLLVPLFLVYAEFQRVVGLPLIGSYTGLVLTDLTFALPLCIWLLVAHFATMPRAVEEAAAVDGAAPVTVLLRIVLPGAAPGIAAVATFAFAAAWGEVLFASVLVDDRTRTLPVGLPAYATESLPHWNELFAASTLASLPVLAIFIAARRVLVRGLAGEGAPDSSV